MNVCSILGSRGYFQINIIMRIIGHLDMDAFFAAVEERDSPQFSGRPIVVGSDPLAGRGRGVVSTANYKAREYGIHSALPISRAWQLSERARRQGEAAAVFLPVNFKRYKEVSVCLLAILGEYSPLIETAGIDEAYFELSQAGSFTQAVKICRAIKQAIKDKEKLTASIGVGPNKLIAKIASDIQKPDGLEIISANEAEAFLEPLSIRKIPGVGPKTEELFKRQGIRLVRDLKKFFPIELKSLMGKWGADLYQKIRARDETPLVSEHEVKSIGEQETFAKDTLDPIFILERLKSLCQNVFKRFEQGGFKGFKTVAITVRLADFETKTRAHTLKNPISDAKILNQEALKLFLPFLDSRANQRKLFLRLIGVKIERLL